MSGPATHHMLTDLEKNALKRRYHLEDLGMDGKIILEWILEK
jgi:hypothetical protein